MYTKTVGPRSPMAEAEDLKSSQCRFESDRGHQKDLIWILNLSQFMWDPIEE